MRISVLDYIDYREFLKDYIEAQKEEKKWFSIRYFANKLMMNHGNLIKVLQEKRHLSDSVVTRILDHMGLAKKEENYFRTLVQFNKSRSEKKSKKLFQELLSIKTVTKKELHLHQYEYYQKWYHIALYSLLDYYPFQGNYEELGLMLDPPISGEEVQNSLHTLETLGLIEEDEQGGYRHCHKVLTTGDKWQSSLVHKFQGEMIKLSERSLKQHPRNFRDISTITMSIGKEDLATIRELIKKCRKSIIEVIHEGESSDHVYQLNMQFFPLTKRKGGVYD